MADDRYEMFSRAMREPLLHTKFAKQKEPSFRDTVLELPNDMELGAFIREWINENPENGLNIKYLNTKK